MPSEIISVVRSTPALLPKPQPQAESRPNGLELDAEAKGTLERFASSRTIAESSVLLAIIHRDGMSDAQIRRYEQSQGLAITDLNTMYKSGFLTRDFEGQWRIKPKVATYLEGLLRIK